MAAFGKAQQDLDKIGETYKANFDRTRHAGEDYHIVVIPWKSLAEADGQSPLPHGKAYQDALGESGAKKVASLSSDSIVFNDVSIYAFSPQLSYVFKEWVDADPGYWALKPISSPGPAPAKKKAPANTEEKKQ